ncbi:MAG: hypothetical protein COA36_02290 [Desulfotalea sp.]|nr:MAG: hypothetical protein COA36_02290 [Desulfotalea sp.]
MTKNIILSGIFLLCFGLNFAYGADVLVKYPVKDAMAIEKVKKIFTDDIAFYWGDAKHGKVSKTYGNFKTSKRTNGFAKERSQACAWAMASSLVTLRDRARREGGNAVINIVSNIKNNVESSESVYTCLAGRVVVNVALKGTVVTIQK